MSEPSLKKNWRTDQTADRLAKHYREIGIKAVAAAVKSENKKEAGQEEESPSSTKQNETHSKRRESNQ